jgi:tetratricopeptide (TPR) repeat protein
VNSTKLSAFCDKVLETGWLLALIITPLFFNVYSSRVFEPDKLTTLRTIALIMAAVWVVKIIEERISGQREVELTWRTPLVFPTLFTVVVYLLSTLLSVTARVSLLGSYQRLQGTYTTLAYIVLFLIILQGLRTRAQLDRLITVVILNSLPIALYGLIQRNRLDPLPWGGDVTQRVASNMGNPIFVAAYLIMATFPTLARVMGAFRSILTDEETNAADILRAAAYIFIFLVQVIAIWYTQSRGPLMGLLAGLGVWVFLGLLALQRAARQDQPFKPSDLPRDVRWGLAFGLGGLAAAGIAAVLLYLAGKAVVEPGSSLPQGMAMVAAALVLMGAWLALVVSRQGWRWLWIGALTMVVLFAIAFLLINLSGPLHQWALGQPSLGRLARVLQHESGTGKVRSLIWEGALDLILPHEPIEYPPTQVHPQGQPDSLNGLRPLVGYGPESMYVAYNRFYPPLLGHFESRTASPDRSHNETMDSLAITGLLGFIAYLWLFGSVFYFGLHWLGLLPADWRRTVFFALQAVGAVVSVAVVIPTVGPHFFGLAIPIGMVGGLFVYLIVYGFSVYWDPGGVPETHPHFVVLAGILSAVVAHFVEINFGIAIASTRTTFWAYAGVLVVVGMGLVGEREPEPQGTWEEDAGSRKQGGKGRRRRRKAAPSPPAQLALPKWLWPTLAVAVIGGFVLGTLAFDFTTNAERLSQPLTIVWRALTVLPAQGSRISYGALMIFTLTWLMGAAIFISEMAKDGTFRERQGDLTLATVVYLLISLTVGFAFALVLAGRQASLFGVQAQTLEDVIDIADRVAGLLATYYGFIVFVLIGGGMALLLGTRRLPRQTAHPWGVMALIVSMVLAGAAAVATNLMPIQADTVYKQADPYDRGKQWLVAIEHYKRAIELAPREDFYYLYLGRAYLEYAATLEDPAVQDAVMRETEQVLVRAREINPLNTDHSANLARMYRRWADTALDAEMRPSLLRRSAENYAIATSLSPQNAILWNEWAMLYYYGLGDVAGYERTLQHSLELDPGFEQTWLMCGDINRQEGKLEEAAHCYEEALELNPRAPQVWRVVGDTYIALQRWGDAIDALTRTVELEPDAGDVWNIHNVLARLYSQIGQQEQALVHAAMALQLAPEDQQAMLQDLLAQLQALETTPP